MTKIAQSRTLLNLKLLAVVVQEYVVITSTYQPSEKKKHHLLECEIGQIKDDRLGAVDNGNH